MKEAISKEWETWIQSVLGPGWVTAATVLSFPASPDGRKKEKEASRLCRERLSSASWTSLSHSKSENEGMVIAIGLTPPSAPDEDQRILGVGVDLEATSRAMDTRIEPRLLSAKERELSQKVGLPLLGAWVLKEACFKASQPNPGTVLPQYCIASIWRSATRSPLEPGIRWREVWEGEVEGPQGKVRFRLLQEERWTVALALA